MKKRSTKKRAAASTAKGRRKGKAARGGPVAAALSRISDRDLLSLRVKDIARRLDLSTFDAEVGQLYRELAAKGLRNFRPRFFLGDEWFAPSDMVAIAIPFILAHPRLRTLSSKMLEEVEGAKRARFMDIMRHEAGHCFDHAFGLHKTKEWQKLFGSPRRKYNTSQYKADADSKDFVINLDEHYAQSHPEEDFAETFAVWLNPRSNWRERYSDWPVALKKLRYVDRMAKKYCLEPVDSGGPLFFGNANRMSSSLADHYAARRRAKDENEVTYTEAEAS